MSVWGTSNSRRLYLTFGILRGSRSRMGLILDISPRNLERVLYFAAYIVTDPGKGTNLAYKEILTETQYREARDMYGDVL